MWQDERNGGIEDIYAQRVDGFGRPLWGADGVAICGALNQQVKPRIIADGTGGAIIVWEDGRNGYSDIYAQRVDATGAVLWPTDGVVVTTAINGQYTPEMCSDGAGGAIFVWRDYRSGTNQDIYARRVDASGDTLLTANGVAVCTDANDQYLPQIASDGLGGAIITWYDYRNGNPDIYAQRVNASGNALWTPDGVAICTAVFQQYEPHIVSDGTGGAIITWYDFRSGNYDIYAQRVDQDGGMWWSIDGQAICTATNDQREPRIASDEAGGAIITWYDSRGDQDIYAQRVDGTGSVLWIADGISVCDATNSQWYPEITSDGAGGAIVAWRDYRNGNSDIYAQRVDASGNLLWAIDDVAVSTAIDDQWCQKIAWDGAGGAFVAWDDHRTLQWDIYAQRIERNGYWGYPAPDIHAVRDIPGDQGGFLDVSWDASRLDPWPEMLITQYTVWRAISAGAAAGMMEEGAHVLSGSTDVLPEVKGSVLRIEEVSGETFYWELISIVDAYYLESYSKVIPTLFDSTSVTSEYHYFQVIAHTPTSSIFWISPADSGYSVDNLSPEAPGGVSGDYSYPLAELLITWDPNLESDLSHYAVYRGSEEGFLPGEGNRLGTVQDTFFVDDAFDPNVDNYYKVSAWDIHENESDFSLLRPDEITGVGSPAVAPLVTRLEQNVPNPFNPLTVIRFSVAEPGMVRLVIYDVLGRPVRALIEGHRGIDRYEVTWDGSDDARRAAASGVYIYQLETPRYVESKKMVLLR